MSPSSRTSMRFLLARAFDASPFQIAQIPLVAPSLAGCRLGTGALAAVVLAPTATAIARGLAWGAFACLRPASSGSPVTSWHQSGPLFLRQDRHRTAVSAAAHQIRRNVHSPPI